MNRQRALAARAHAQILAIRQLPNEATRKKLKTLCMKTPALIHQSGAVQAIAFLRSREGAIGRDFSTRLAVVMGVANDDALHALAVSDTDVVAYMMFTERLSDAAVWLRRFAQSDLADVEDNDDE